MIISKDELIKTSCTEDYKRVNERLIDAISKGLPYARFDLLREGGEWVWCSFTETQLVALLREAGYHVFVETRARIPYTLKVYWK